MTINSKWSRRKFSKAVLSAQLLLASSSIAFSTSCLHDTQKKDGSILNSKDDVLLKIIMDLLIPETESHSSASAVGGLNYIKGILEELPEIKPVFLEIFKRIRSTSEANNKKTFTKLNQDAQVKLLLEFESNDSSLFEVLKDFVYESYYTNEVVWEEIGYESFPTGSMGPKMKPFDPSLLNRVKGSPITYKNV